MRPLLGATCAFLVMLVLATPAHAVPDGPLGPYLERDQPLALAWPAQGSVTDGFGPRWGRMHLGIDVGILASVDLVAAEPGTVTDVGYLDGYGGYGNVVVVDIGDGRSLLYAHLTAASVSAGEWVDEGDPIGTAGCTGSCTGTHLHFELRRDGVPVDPAPFLSGQPG
jgi:murein DD-endopeptidase MepM/ murein hydrolase activator NlpD